MKIKLSLASVFCISIFLFSMIQVSGQNTITNWTFSEELRAGDYFKWDINMTWDGSPITEVGNSNDGPPFIDGSVMEVTLKQDPFGLFVQEDMTTAQLDPVFSMNLDGNTTMNPELMPAFVYPNTYIMDDGSHRNTFEYMLVNNLYLPFFGENDTVTHEINGGNYWTTGVANYPEEGRTTTQWFNYDISTGILHWVNINEVYTNGSEMVASIGIMEQQTSGGGPPGLTFSDNLRTGDYFRWEVNATWEGNAVTQADTNDGPPFVDGTSIELEILQDPYGLLFEGDVTEAQLTPYFALNIDGDTTVNPEIMPALLFPNTYTREDGSDGNIFELFIAENEPLPFFDGGGTFTHEINGDNYWISGTAYYPDEGRTTNQWFNFDVSTGIMHWISISEVYTNGSELLMSIGIVDQRTSGDGGIPEGASFSPLLDTGDKFTWTITTLREQGTTVTTDPTNPNEPGQGAVITIDILDEPENFDIWADTQDVDTFFGFKIDGNVVLIKDIFEGPGDFAQFIYPVIVDFQNGTVINFFEYIVAHPTEEFFGPSSSITASISNNIFSLQITEVKDEGLRNVVQDMEFNVDTGVMRKLMRTETWTNGTEEFVMEINLTDEFYADGTGTTEPTSSTTTNTDDTSDPNPLPAPGFIWILPILIAIPILRRKQ